jgi:hypothetical protein
VIFKVLEKRPCASTQDVSVFVTDHSTGAEDTRTALEEDNIPIFDRPRAIKLHAIGQVGIVTERGSLHQLDAIYPAPGCDVRSKLATSCTETEVSSSTPISVQLCLEFTQLETS